MSCMFLREMLILFFLQTIYKASTLGFICVLESLIMILKFVTIEMRAFVSFWVYPEAYGFRLLLLIQHLCELQVMISRTVFMIHVNIFIDEFWRFLFL